MRFFGISRIAVAAVLSLGALVGPTASATMPTPLGQLDRTKTYLGTPVAFFLYNGDETFISQFRKVGVSLYPSGPDITYANTLYSQFAARNLSLSDADVIALMINYLIERGHQAQITQLLTDRALLAKIPADRAQRVALYPQFFGVNAQNPMYYFSKSSTDLVKIMDAEKAGFPAWVKQHLDAHADLYDKTTFDTLNIHDWKLGNNARLLIDEAAKVRASKRALNDQLRTSGALTGTIDIPLSGGVAVSPFGANFSASDGTGAALDFTCPERGSKIFEVSLRQEFSRDNQDAFMAKLIEHYGPPTQRATTLGGKVLVWGTSYPLSRYLGGGGSDWDGLIATFSDSSFKLVLRSSELATLATQCNALHDAASRQAEVNRLKL
jgi:hypothetical protein